MEQYREENVSLNSFQISAMLFKAKLKYLIAGRATGKSYINGADVDENVRFMLHGAFPRTIRAADELRTVITFSNGHAL